MLQRCVLFYIYIKSSMILNSMEVFVNPFHPALPLVLFKWNQRNHTQRIAIGSDVDIGGQSRAYLTSDEKNDCSKFHGEILENPQKQMMSWDLSRYAYISLYGMGDTHTYFLNLQTTSFLESDLYQVPFTFKVPGKWETICIPLNAFRLKGKGTGLSKHRFSGTERIQTVGISLLNQQPGPFELYIRWIKATNEVQ
ncbi:hypothetical protein PORY_000880 [Pneumocystis oryctolagi]|uniref:Uncharacterized protein n=1 Tax=Pneumocystis oryctolagi TaxID=42067 RepID=A0ACB7CF13_9ASCO|nr:hypothetical protein PORY_000880 [Pneumocystis oryctolagi]